MWRLASSLVVLLSVGRGFCPARSSALAAQGIRPAPSSVQGPRVTRTLPYSADASISIEATAGEIRVIGHDAADVTVDLIADAPTSAQLATLTPEITADAQRIRVRAVQADGGLDASVRSTVRIGVPRSARIDSIKLLTGRIVLDDLHGVVSADVTRGSLSASKISGTVRLETGTGDLVCEHARLTPGGLLRLRAFNGAVTLQFDAPPPDARILAMSFNGRITSAIPLKMKESFGPKFGEATLGTGEPVVSIDTVTGDIAITVAAGR